MKFVLSSWYGGFHLKKEWEDILKERNGSMKRNNPVLIDIIQSSKGKALNDYCEYSFVEIPDEVTDYMVDNYDGWEFITYCLDGKIYKLIPHTESQSELYNSLGIKVTR